MFHSLTPAERSLRARIGALALHAQYDAQATTAKAREIFLSKFEREVDPDGILPPDERQRRAQFARKAHFTRMALQSAKQARLKRDAKTKATGANPVTSQEVSDAAAPTSR